MSLNSYDSFAYTFEGKRPKLNIKTRNVFFCWRKHGMGPRPLVSAFERCARMTSHTSNWILKVAPPPPQPNCTVLGWLRPHCSATQPPLTTPPANQDPGFNTPVSSIYHKNLNAVHCRFNDGLSRDPSRPV